MSSLLFQVFIKSHGLREKATKLAFSIEEAPCSCTGFFTQRLWIFFLTSQSTP